MRNKSITINDLKRTIVNLIIMVSVCCKQRNNMIMIVIGCCYKDRHQDDKRKTENYNNYEFCNIYEYYKSKCDNYD